MKGRRGAVGTSVREAAIGGIVGVSALTFCCSTPVHQYQTLSHPGIEPASVAVRELTDKGQKVENQHVYYMETQRRHLHF